jgi:hypothetical protein
MSANSALRVINELKRAILKLNVDKFKQSDKRKLERLVSVVEADIKVLIATLNKERK